MSFLYFFTHLKLSTGCSFLDIVKSFYIILDFLLDRHFSYSTSISISCNEHHLYAPHALPLVKRPINVNWSIVSLATSLRSLFALTSILALFLDSVFNLLDVWRMFMLRSCGNIYLLLNMSAQLSFQLIMSFWINTV